MRNLLIAAIAALFPFLAGAQVQELRANVNLSITNASNTAFSFSVANNSTAPYSITQVSIGLTPTSVVFDTFGTVPSGVSFTPDPGSNNDGSSANLVSISGGLNILPGQTLNTSGGDIDSAAPTGINVTVGFSDGSSVSGPLVLSGSTWSAQLSKTADLLYPINLSWLPPTQNTDGSPYTDPAGYNLYWGSIQGSYANSKRITDPATQMDTIQVPAGRWYFVATAINLANKESAFSNVAEGVAAPQPGSPFLSAPLEIPTEASELAFMVFTIRNQILFVEAGSVQSGAGCDADQAIRGQMPDGSIKNLYLVAVEDVQLLPSLPPGGEYAVFAECGTP